MFASQRCWKAKFKNISKSLGKHWTGKKASMQRSVCSPKTSPVFNSFEDVQENHRLVILGKHSRENLHIRVTESHTNPLLLAHLVEIIKLKM